jgi:predicted DNA-binding transcriptional regulator YafY
MEQISNTLTFSILQKLNTKMIKMENAIDLIKLAMETVESQGKLNGQQKAEAVIRSLHFIAHNDVLEKFTSKEVAVNIKVFIESNNLVPTIDAIVAATKGRIDVNITYFRSSMTQSTSTVLKSKGANILGHFGRLH